MTEHILTPESAQDVISALQDELNKSKSRSLLINTSNGGSGKVGMHRLWRMWMVPTAKYMASRGAKMPLYIKANGEPYGERDFNAEDAHAAFTAMWLGVDKNGDRLSWSKSGRDGMRPATKGERFICMLRHEEFAVKNGIMLSVPRDSEFFKNKESEKY